MAPLREEMPQSLLEKDAGAAAPATSCLNPPQAAGLPLCIGEARTQCLEASPLRVKVLSASKRTFATGVIALNVYERKGAFCKTALNPSFS